MNLRIKKPEALIESEKTKRDIVLLAVSGAALIVSLFDLLPVPFDAAWIAVFLCSVPIILKAVTGLVTSFDIKADVLVSLALIASVCIGEIFAAGEIALIMQAGALLEDLTVAKARAGLARLVRLTPQTARILGDSGERIVPAEQVKAGDILRVLPGETIPVDGEILLGQTSVNQAVMTGESLPVDKEAGDEVFGGTVNQFGVFEMKAVNVGEDSSIQRMIRLVQSVDAGKAKIVRLADRWATWIVVAALTAAVLTWFVSGQIIRAVTILVVFCPCALVLATPTAIVAAMGNAVRHGFLIKEGDALERIAKVSGITFDKTGTLTEGTLRVTAVRSVSSFTEKEVYLFAAAAEQMSEHPLGKAILQCYRENTEEMLPPCEEFQMLPGKGVRVVVNGRKVLAGSRRMLEEEMSAVRQRQIEVEMDSSAVCRDQLECNWNLVRGSESENKNKNKNKNEVGLPENNSSVFSPAEQKEADKYLKQGGTVIWIMIDGTLSGFVVLSDTVRSESISLIDQIKELGIQPVLLTGDHAYTARTIAEELHISEVYANCLPEDKLSVIKNYQEKGDRICMIGDGVNDAPALKAADVGIAMGGIGSDIAVDAADLAIVNDKIGELPHLLALSKRMMGTIRINLAFSMTLNFLAIGLAISGILNPVVGALIHNAGSVLVIVHSALLLRWKS